MKKKALIIGGGIGGVVAALSLKNKGGWDPLIVEKSKRIGGGIRTHYVGGHPCTFGPRHFLTHSQRAFDYLNKYVPLRLCSEHVFWSYVESDKSFYNYPIHYDDIPRMPEKDTILREVAELDADFRDKEYQLSIGTEEKLSNVNNYKDFWLKSVGSTLYQKFISKYTRKMWQVDDESIIDDFTWSPKGVAIKSGPREGWDSAISAYPKNLDGYDPIFVKAEKEIEVLLNTAVSVMPNSLKAEFNGSEHEFDLIINTVPLDEIFLNTQLPKLKYIGRTLEYVVLPVEFALPENIYFCYYTGDEKYTRVTEYKKFTQYKSDATLISIEYPSDKGRYYPMPTESCKEIYRKYQSLQHENFFSIGRLGLYNYRYDIDDAVDQAIDLVTNV